MNALSLIGCHWAAATINVNGWKSELAGSEEMRKYLMLQMFCKHGVEVAAVQEHHITGQLDLDAQIH